MTTTTSGGFDRDGRAEWYARKHLKTVPGTTAIYYLPGGAPEREVRLLEVNDLIGESTGPLKPVDSGVNVDGPDSHTLYVLDVTPAQWHRIHPGELSLPGAGALDGAGARRVRGNLPPPAGGGGGEGRREGGAGGAPPLRPPLEPLRYRPGRAAGDRAGVPRLRAGEPAPHHRGTGRGVEPAAGP